MTLKCLDGYTQNACESFNARIWKRCPKEIYTGRGTVFTAFCLAVSHFNDGAISTVEIFKELGVQGGSHTFKWAKGEDAKRVKASLKRSEQVQKKIRQSLRQSRKETDKQTIEKEGITYEPGGF